MAALSALAEYPGRIESLFLNKEISEAGAYGVQFYALGVPITITIDDWLPVDKNEPSKTWYAQIGDDGALWPSIIEKAFAKFLGSYARQILGDAVDGISTLNGSPSIKINHREDSKEELWNMLQTYDSEHHRGMLIAATPGDTDAETNSSGLRQNHSYTVLGVRRLNSGQRVIKVRNPWGSETFTGTYSDSTISNSVLQELDHSEGDDGVFYMSLN